MRIAEARNRRVHSRNGRGSLSEAASAASSRGSSSPRAGIDASGHMFFDLSDENTASAFVAQKDRFSGIKISE